MRWLFQAWSEKILHKACTNKYFPPFCVIFYQILHETVVVSHHLVVSHHDEVILWWSVIMTKSSYGGQWSWWGHPMGVSHRDEVILWWSVLGHLVSWQCVVALPSYVINCVLWWEGQGGLPGRTGGGCQLARGQGAGAPATITLHCPRHTLYVSQNSLFQIY